MKFFRKTVLALVGASLVAGQLFAAPVDVRWSWLENDSNVSYYRYQLDSLADDGWTVVSDDVKSFTATVEGSEAHTLYLQQSYDGRRWSDLASKDSPLWEGKSVGMTSITVTPDDLAAYNSATREGSNGNYDVAISDNDGNGSLSVTGGTEYGMEPLKTDISQRTVMLDSEGNPVFDAEGNPVYVDSANAASSAVSVLAPSVSLMNNDMITEIGKEVYRSQAPSVVFDIKASYERNFITSENGLSAGIDVKFDDIARLGSVGFDMTMGFGALLTPENIAGDTSALAGLTVPVGSSEFSLAGGFRMLINKGVMPTYGIKADAGYRYNFNEYVNLGLNVGYTYLFRNAGEHVLDAGLNLGFRFW